MQLTTYQRAFIDDLQRTGVRFIVLGGMAMRAHGLNRETKDMDILVDRSHDNVELLLPIIARRFLNSPPKLTVEWMSRPEKLVSLPTRETSEIDILTSCGALDFAAAFANRKDVASGDAPIPILGLRELIYTKLASADRNEHPAAVDRDLADLVSLLRAWQEAHQ